MEGIKELDRLAKELVYQITGVEVKDTLSADYQIAYRYLEKVSKQNEQLINEPEYCNKHKWNDCECTDVCRRGLSIT